MLNATTSVLFPEGIYRRKKITKQHNNLVIVINLHERPHVTNYIYFTKVIICESRKQPLMLSNTFAINLCIIIVQLMVYLFLFFFMPYHPPHLFPPPSPSSLSLSLSLF